jgi:hypothetical protein
MSSVVACMCVHVHATRMRVRARAPLITPTRSMHARTHGQSHLERALNCTVSMVTSVPVSVRLPSTHARLLSSHILYSGAGYGRLAQAPSVHHTHPPVLWSTTSARVFAWSKPHAALPSRSFRALPLRHNNDGGCSLEYYRSGSGLQRLRDRMLVWRLSMATLRWTAPRSWRVRRLRE